MTETPSPAPDSTPGMSRRSVLKGAAWSTPLIAAAISAPATAASTVPIDPVINIDAFKSGSDHGFIITNTGSTVVTVVVSFVGEATGQTDILARLNLIAATDVGLGFVATYAQEKSGVAIVSPPIATYQSVWVDEPVVANGTATRSGEATMTLGSGATFKFWQTSAIQFFGSPSITATVMVDDGDVAVLELP